ncbi:MAG: hotdog domain-containing protein, partial [Actinomycetota bacterium]|nr:hotdog domain-containing protein [Actinomycetota bacterium]
RAIMVRQHPEPVADGDTIEFARHSLIGGTANPFGVDATYVRDGEEVVAHVALGAAFEGPPGRAHGGVVSAVVDETMTALITQLGRPAFTTGLELSYLSASPLHAPLEFRASLVEKVKNRLTITCVGRSGEHDFVEATGTFVEVDLAHLIEDMGRLDEG